MRMMSWPFGMEWRPSMESMGFALVGLVAGNGDWGDPGGG